MGGSLPSLYPLVSQARKGCFLKGFTTRKPTSSTVKPLRLAMFVFEKNSKSAQRFGEPLKKYADPYHSSSRDKLIMLPCPKAWKTCYLHVMD